MASSSLGIVPALSRVALLWNPDNASNRLAVEEVRVAAGTLGMTFIAVPVQAPTRLGIDMPRSPMIRADEMIE